MTPIDGLTLAEAEHAIENAHPGWHVWHSREGGEYATTTMTDPQLGGSGTTLDAPSVETIEQKIGQWEWEHQHATGSAA